MRAGIHQSITAISAAACVALAGGLTAAVTGGAAVAAVPTTRTAPTQHSTVVVRGLAFPEGRAMRLGLVGCDNVYERVAESPQAMIGAGPGSAPAGERVLRYDLVGGNALGPLSYVSSVALTQSAGLTAYAEQGTTGVVWAGYQEPADRHTGRVWFGRAEVVVPPGQWTRIEATDLTYSWSKWDMYAQAPVADGVDDGADEGADEGAAEEPVPDGTLADMVLRHRGDGAGFVMTGLGCDGNEFAIDALRLHTAGTATTYDIEGLETSVGMPPPPVRRAEAGQPVELRGTLVDSTGAPLSGVTHAPGVARGRRHRLEARPGRRRRRRRSRGPGAARAGHQLPLALRRPADGRGQRLGGRHDRGGRAGGVGHAEPRPDRQRLAVTLAEPRPGRRAEHRPRADEERWTDEERRSHEEPDVRGAQRDR